MKTAGLVFMALGVAWLLLIGVPQVKPYIQSRRTRDTRAEVGILVGIMTWGVFPALIVCTVAGGLIQASRS